MARAADKLWTLEEFLAFDDGSETELFEGRIVAIIPRSGDTQRSRGLARIIGDQLRPPCEAIAERASSRSIAGTAGTRRT